MPPKLLGMGYLGMVLQVTALTRMGRQRPVIAPVGIRVTKSPIECGDAGAEPAGENFRLHSRLGLSTLGNE